MSSIHVMRHGALEEDGSLTSASAETARRNAQTLIAKGLGSSAVVLSSNVYRAVATAEAVSKELGGAELVKSVRVALAADWPYISGVRNLEDLFSKALEEEGSSSSTEQGLVVVAHSPLVAAIQDGRLGRDWDVGYGEMVEYAPGTWPTSGSIDRNEPFLEAAVAEALAERRD